MLRFISRRAALAIPTLIGSSLVLFITIQLTPGDPIASLLGPTSTPEAREALTAKLGLDKPLVEQYLRWFWNVLQGDLGTSIARQESALGLVWSFLKNTLILAGFAGLLAIVGGVLIGLVGALFPRSLISRLVSGFALFSVSVPQYSIALILVVYPASKFGWFPTAGMNDARSGGGFGDLLHHLWLPGFAGALVPLGIVARMVRSSMIDTMNQDFVEALRARGLRQRTLVRHAFRSALPGIMTIAGLQIGYLIGGILFVEVIFSWPGMGQLIFNSISQRDLPVIQAGVMLSVLVFVAVNLFVDVAQAALDPRIRR